MYQLPRQLAEIIKPMVQNEMQQTKELEARRVNKIIALIDWFGCVSNKQVNWKKDSGKR